MACLTENTIVEYLEGLLDDAASAAAEQHLDDCFVCRRLVVEVAATLLDSARTATPVPSEEVVTRVTKILAARRTAPETDASDAEGEADALAGVPDILPEVAGRYRDLRVQGRGGQARVLVAWDEYMGREVALKQLRPVDKPLVDEDLRDRLRQTAENATRFLREVRITGQLSHPSIVPVHEVGRRADGTLYYTMPIVGGRTLAEALADCDDLTDRLGLLDHFVDLCHGVAYAHSRGVIHRDLKPANVMIGEFGETLLLDWGLATFARPADADQTPPPALEDPLAPESGPPTPSGISLGTPSYMSPEQAAGHVREVDHRADVWGLGAILYEILTGQPPHTGPSALQIIVAVATKPVVGVTERCPEAPEALATLTERALQREREDRPDSAKELADGVTAYLAAERDAAASAAAKHAPSRRPLLIVGGALLLALGLLAGYLLAPRPAKTPPGPSEQTDAAQTKADRSATRTLCLVYDGRMRELWLKKRWLEARIYGAAARRWCGAAARTAHLRALEHQLRRRRPGEDLIRHRLWRARGCEPGPGAAVVLMADGRHAATGCDHGKLEVWRLADGKTVRSTASHGKSIHRLMRGPNGRIAAGTVDGLVALFTAQGTLHRTLHGHRGRVHALTISPSGRLLATAADDDTVRLWSLTTNQLLHSRDVEHAVHTLVFAADGKHLTGRTRTGDIRHWRIGGDGRTLAAVAKPKSMPQTLLRPGDPRQIRLPGSRRSITGDDHGLISLRSVVGNQDTLSAVRGHFAPVVGLAADANAHTLYSVDRRGVRQAWRLGQAQPNRQGQGRNPLPPPDQALQTAQRAAGLTLLHGRLRPLTERAPSQGAP